MGVRVPPRAQKTALGRFFCARGGTLCGSALAFGSRRRARVPVEWGREVCGRGGTLCGSALAFGSRRRARVPVEWGREVCGRGGTLCGSALAFGSRRRARVPPRSDASCQGRVGGLRSRHQPWLMPTILRFLDPDGSVLGARSGSTSSWWSRGRSRRGVGWRRRGRLGPRGRWRR